MRLPVLSPSFRRVRWTALPVALALAGAAATGAAAAPGARPNLVWIVADDLGPGDLGPYGQARIATPRLDRFAAEGTRFTAFYAGSAVCAPSREALMTGRHTGHTRMRGNARTPLTDADPTVAEVLRVAGYATGAFGKWGLGDAGSRGAPLARGFDTFFGYLDQGHAHNPWPDRLWSDDAPVGLPNRVARRDAVGAGVATRRVEYAPARIVLEALAFLDARRDGRPFFLYLPVTLPHANNEADAMEVPGWARAHYAEADWPEPQRRYAAAVTLLDAQLGAVLDRLASLGMARRTLVLFTADNGPHAEGGVDPAFFDSTQGRRGAKRSLWEGGIRVPLIVRWPGRVPAGAVSDVPWAMWDLPATAAALAGVPLRAGGDGRSAAALLQGRARRGPWDRRVLYWELHDGGRTWQAARRGRFKRVVRDGEAPVLFDLEQDPAETRDVSTQHPDVADALDRALAAEHEPSRDWPLPGE